MPVLLWILMLPLGAALLTPLVGRVWDRHIGWWAAALSAASAGLLLAMGPAIGRGDVLGFTADWPAAMWGIRFSLFADGWGWTFALLIAGIGTLICVYSQYYLHAHERRVRFFSYLLFFEGAMLGVVLSSNLIVLVVFWELTSVASFLLIGFWDEEEKARYGAYKALLITAIGGLALLAGVILLYGATGTFELRELFAKSAQIQAHPHFVPILVLILLGAFTKSAQFPFHLWLPDAMTAPTPVSAYLHSATMVKAGVFLLARVFPIFRGSSEWVWIVSVVGLVTMLVGAYGALRKTDLKALLAYSTISQLGLITMLYGFGTDLAALAATFHILNHAAFKAGLFLVAGIVEHETGSRDLRDVSGLSRLMPVTAAICGVVALASAGVPLLNGFLSKELFYEASVAHAQHAALGWLWPTLAVAGSVFTFVYSMMVFVPVFFGAQLKANRHPQEAPLGLLVPTGALAAVCVVVGLWPGVMEGWVLKPAVLGVLQSPLEFHIALFHGLTTPLMMSALTLAAGLVVYAKRSHLFRVQNRIAWPFSANTIYDGCMDSLMNRARLMTDALQSGKLRNYYWIITLFFLLAVGFLFYGSDASQWIPSTYTPADAGEIVLILLLVASALCVVWLNTQRVPAVITLGAVGGLISVQFLVMSAPDLALTQLLIESVTLILFLLVLWFLPKDTPRTSSRRLRVTDGVFSIVFGFAIFLVVLGVFASGRENTALTDFFAANSLLKAGGRNIVNVILVDFRGFDTLGEVTVLGIAALSAYALVKLRRKKEKPQ